MTNLRVDMTEKPISLNLRNFEKRVGEHFEWVEFVAHRSPISKTSYCLRFNEVTEF